MKKPLTVCLVSRLALAELELLDLDALALSADDGLQAAVALADRLFEILTALHDRDRAGLLYLAVETAEQVLGRFLTIFACNLYHIRNIVAQQITFCNNA